MRKTKYLALVLVVAIMMMGAGYAYWTETLTIENTITTGELDFTFQNAKLISTSEWMDFDGESSVEVDTEDDNKVNIVLEDMYPGAEATFSFDLFNSGTMKAKLKNFVISNFDQIGYFNVKSLKVNGTQFGPVALENLNSKLNDLNIDKGSIIEFEVTLEVVEANGSDIGENLNAITFSIEAAGLQYNDDIN